MKKRKIVICTDTGIHGVMKRARVTNSNIASFPTEETMLQRMKSVFSRKHDVAGELLGVPDRFSQRTTSPASIPGDKATSVAGFSKLKDKSCSWLKSMGCGDWSCARISMVSHGVREDVFQDLRVETVGGLVDSVPRCCGCSLGLLNGNGGGACVKRQRTAQFIVSRRSSQ